MRNDCRLLRSSGPIRRLCSAFYCLQCPRGVKFEGLCFFTIITLGEWLIRFGRVEDKVFSIGNRFWERLQAAKMVSVESIWRSLKQELLKIFNGFLEVVVFPGVRKEATIALIPKPGRDGFRSICPLESTGRLSYIQFGFMLGCGTT